MAFLYQPIIKDGGGGANWVVLHEDCVFVSVPSCLMKQKMISDVWMRSRNMSRVSINLSQNLSPNMRHSVTGMDSSGQRLLSGGSVNLTSSSTEGSPDVAIKISSSFCSRRFLRNWLPRVEGHDTSQESRLWDDPAERKWERGWRIILETDWVLRWAYWSDFMSRIFDLKQFHIQRWFIFGSFPVYFSFRLKFVDWHLN